MDEARAIPLYDRGSLGSAVLDLGIGLIILLPQEEGMHPVSKQTLNKTCKNVYVPKTMFWLDSNQQRALYIHHLFSLDTAMAEFKKSEKSKKRR